MDNSAALWTVQYIKDLETQRDRLLALLREARDGVDADSAGDPNSERTRWAVDLLRRIDAEIGECK